MLKILARIPHANDGVSMYRGWGPLSHLRRIYPIEFISPEQYTWSTLVNCDLLYMVRPATDQDLGLLRMAKRCGIPIWIDYDDNLLAVPKHNPSFNFYARKNIQENIKLLLKEASLVTVTTGYLSTEYFKYRDSEISIIPNAFPDHIFDWNESNLPRRKIVSWRGSRTHDKDLSLVHEQLKILQDFAEGWEIYFYGEIDYLTQDLLDLSRVKIFPYSDTIDFFKAFKSSSAAIHIVPLEDNAFNRSKSNIAWIEASWAGAAVFASRLPEFNQPGVQPIENFLNIKLEDLSQQVETSRSFIKENLLISKINHKRLNIIEGLIK